MTTQITPDARIQSQIETLEKKLKQAKEKARKIAAQQVAAAAKKARADDTRKKVLVGGTMLALIKRGEWQEAELMAILDRSLERPADRALFGLQERPAAAPQQ